MSSLSQKHCKPCSTGSSALNSSQVEDLLKIVDGWSYVEGHHLEKSYSFKNFKDALKRVNQIGEIAEAEGHHPDLFLSWGKVRVQLWTHKVNGLTENDFILASKIDGITEIE